MEIVALTRELAALTWCCRELFERTGAEVASIDEPVAKVAVATTSRLLGEVALVFGAQVPESILLAEHALLVSDGGPLAALVDGGVGPERLRAEVLPGLVGVLETLRDRCGAVAEASALRVLDQALRDLSECRSAIDLAAPVE